MLDKFIKDTLEGPLLSNITDLSSFTFFDFSGDMKDGSVNYQLFAEDNTTAPAIEVGITTLNVN